MDNQNTTANVQYNQMKQQMMIYFNSIRDKFAKTNEADIIAKLKEINEEMSVDEDYVLSTEDFELLGDIAYLVGIDMTNSHNFAKIPMQNFRSRFKNVKPELMTAEFVENVTTFFDKVTNKTIRQTMDNLKSQIKNPVHAPKEVHNNIRLAYKKAFKTLIIPVTFAREVNDILVKTEPITYQDILKLNVTIYGAADFGKGSIKYVSELYGNQDFQEIIRKADQMEISQRYAFVRFDSIISTNELLKRLPETFSILAMSDEDFEKFIEQEETKAAEKKEPPVAENKADEIKTEEKETAVIEEDAALNYDPKFHPTNPALVNTMYQQNPDFYIRSIIEEYIKAPVKTLDDVISGWEKMLQDDEIMSNIYTYMAQVESVDTFERKSFDETWENLFTKEQFAEAISNHINAKQDAYKDAVEKITAEIPAEYSNRIITYVNDCIGSLQISGTNEKGYLLTQVNENQIKTWKHLREIIDIIENQKINGTGIETYVTLYNYLNAQTEYTVLLEGAVNYERNTNYLALYNKLKTFYCGKDKNTTEEK